MDATSAGSGRDTEARCPKCRSRSFVVTYVDEVQLQNRVKDGKWVSTFEECAMPTRKAAYGDCSACKHSWRFRMGYIDKD